MPEISIITPVYQAEKAKRMENMPKVAVLYVNNAETTYNDEVDGVVLGNLEKCINDDKYIYINGEPYIEKLNKVGIVDITTAERADIVDAFEGEDVDYVVFIEVQPFIARDKVTFFTVGKDITTTVPLKIIDLVNGKYLYKPLVTLFLPHPSPFLQSTTLSITILSCISSDIRNFLDLAFSEGLLFSYFITSKVSLLLLQYSIK